jgi:hypothetical protein
MRFLGPDASEQSRFKCIVHVMYHESRRRSHREHNRIKPQTWLTAVQICILVHNPLLMPSPIELSLTRCVNCKDTITVHLHFGYTFLWNNYCSMPERQNSSISTLSSGVHLASLDKVTSTSKSRPCHGLTIWYLQAVQWRVMLLKSLSKYPCTHYHANWLSCCELRTIRECQREIHVCLKNFESLKPSPGLESLAVVELLWSSLFEACKMG